MDNGSGFFSIGYHSSFLDRLCRTSANGVGPKQPMEKPLTNEEWFRKQDLASMLIEISWKCQKCEHTESDLKNCPFGRCFKNRPDAEAWLKEEHHDDTD